MTIQLNAKNVYGVVKYYPACELSKLIAGCAGTKTITDSQIRLMEQGGYNIIKTATV